MEEVTNNSVKQIEGIMRATLQNLNSIIDVNNVVGKPIDAGGGATVVPISKITFGFVGGGSEFMGKQKEEHPNTVGGSGAGVAISPVGFLICKDEQSSFIKVDETVEEDKWKSLLKTAMEFIKQ